MPGFVPPGSSPCPWRADASVVINLMVSPVHPTSSRRFVVSYLWLLLSVIVAPTALGQSASAAPIRGRVAVRVLDRATGEAMACRLTIVDAQGRLAAIAADKAAWIAVRPGVIYTATGEAQFTLPPGTYTLHANRGLEYSLVKRALVVAREPVRIEIVLEREVDTTGYISCDPHIHTLTYSRHGDSTVEERMVTIAGEGIELAIATEHNHHADYAPFQGATRTTGHFTSVVGNEVTTPAGHVNAFPVLPASPVPEFRSTDWKVMLASVRNSPGVKVVMLNHPSNDHSNFIPTDPSRFHPVTGESRDGRDWDFDAIETVTSAAMQSDWIKPYRDWFLLLNRGRRMTSMGSSDTHDVNRFILGQGRTYVASRAATAREIDVDEACRSIRDGRTLVSLGLLAEAWVGDRGVGDTVDVRGGPIAVRVRVQAPRWIEADRVEIYLNGELAATQPIVSPKNSSVKFDGRIELPPIAHDAWLVVIASGPGIREHYWPTPRPNKPLRADWEPRVLGSTNPIWLEADGDSRFSSAFAYARRLVTAHGQDPMALVQALNKLDSAASAQAVSILTQESVDMNSPLWRRALGGAEPHVRHAHAAFMHYQAK